MKYKKNTDSVKDCNEGFVRRGGLIISTLRLMPDVAQKLKEITTKTGLNRTRVISEAIRAFKPRGGK